MALFDTFLSNSFLISNSFSAHYEFGSHEDHYILIYGINERGFLIRDPADDGLSTVSCDELNDFFEHETTGGWQMAIDMKDRGSLYMSDGLQDRIDLSEIDDDEISPAGIITTQRNVIRPVTSSIRCVLRHDAGEIHGKLISIRMGSHLEIRCLIDVSAIQDILSRSFTGVKIKNEERILFEKDVVYVQSSELSIDENGVELLISLQDEIVKINV